MKAFLQMLYETATQHVPDSAAWVPYAATGLLGLFGLVLLVKGAKLAPVMSAVTFLVIGGFCGSFVAYWLGTPVWFTIAVSGVIGFALGLVLFKYWLAILVAACCIAGSLTFYGYRVLAPHMANYATRNLGNDVTLPEPGAPVAAAQSTQAELGQVWSFLATQVPSFQTGFWAIVISTGLAGLAFGLLLPRAARALFAATVGTFCLFVAVAALLQTAWPTALPWLASLGTWGWGILGVTWAVFLVHNMLDVRRKRPKKAADDPAAAPVRTARPTA